MTETDYRKPLFFTMLGICIFDLITDLLALTVLLALGSYAYPYTPEKTVPLFLLLLLTNVIPLVMSGIRTFSKAAKSSKSMDKGNYAALLLLYIVISGHWLSLMCFGLIFMILLGVM